MGSRILLAVNGTLMRGLELNGNLLRVGAAFVCEARTAPRYRCWSVADRHPGMLRVTPPEQGAAIALELWELDGAGIAAVLEGEPPGLSVGKVELDDGSHVLGVLAEPWVVAGQREITSFGGWRAYLAALGGAKRGQQG